MGTLVEIHATGFYECKDIKKFTENLSRKFSFQYGKSIVNTTLNNPSMIVQLDYDLEKLVTYGIKLHNYTDGYFNILFRSNKNISSEKITNIIKVDNGSLIKLRKDVIFDFSGLAKGYVIMRIYRQFFSDSPEGYINAGGDILTWGKNIEIRVQDHNGELKKGCLKLKGIWSIFSSGTYLRKEIVDPFSQTKIKIKRVSVVIGKDPVLADGFATALVIKPELVKKLSLKFPNWGFYVEDKKEKLSGGKWKKIYTLRCKN